MYQYFIGRKRAELANRLRRIRYEKKKKTSIIEVEK